MAETIRGFAFPFRFDVEGRVVLAEGIDKLRANIVQLLLTDIGERVMTRDYGGGLRAVVHDPNNDALRAVVQHQARKAITRWESRAQVQEFSIDANADPAVLSASLAFVSRPQLIATSVRLPIGLGS